MVEGSRTTWSEENDSKFWLVSELSRSWAKLGRRRLKIDLGDIDIDRTGDLPGPSVLLTFDTDLLVSLLEQVREQLKATEMPAVPLGLNPWGMRHGGFSPWIDQYGRDIVDKSG